MTSVLLPRLVFASLPPPCTSENHDFVGHFYTPLVLFLISTLPGDTGLFPICVTD
jgi:hypothetical protein